jgi:hypothetical protein
MIHVVCPAGRSALRDWICRVVLGDWLGQDYTLEFAPDAAGWHLTIDDAPGELRLPDSLLGLDETAWLGPASLPRLPLGQWPLPPELQLAGLPRELPVLYGRLLPDKSWLRVVDGPGGLRAELGVDLLGGCLFLLGRYEEYAIDERDEYGRFPPERSVLAQAGALDRPLANEYAELLWKLLSGLWPGLARPERRFRARPTHDIDFAFGVYGRGWWRHLRSLGADLLHRQDADLALRRLHAARQVPRGELDSDVNNNFAWIMAQSEQRGLASTFYFLVDDAHYPIEHPWLGPILRQIHERGHRLGVHPPLGTSQDQVALAACLERFRGALRAAGLPGVAAAPLPARQHYLQWQAPATWRTYAAVGLASDSSCGYAQRAGFRCGSCWPYRPCDLRTGEVLPLAEEPLIAMEASLLAGQYEGLSFPRAVERMRALGRACRAVQGDFVLLWHNDSLISQRQQAAYCAVLDGLE